MRLAVLKERRAAETRVAATPETVKKLIGLGLTVAIETGAGLNAAIPDADFAAAGAEIAPDAAAALSGASIVFAVQMPEPEQRAQIPRGALLVCTANAFADPSVVPALAQAGIDTAAMELLPRITRAQVDGRAVKPGQSRRLSCGHRGRGRLRARLPHDDDGRRHRPARPGVRHRRGRGRATGHRHRATARRDRLGDRRSAGREGGNQLARRDLVGVEDEETAGADGCLREGDERRLPPKAGGADGHHGGQERHHHLHRIGDGPQGSDDRDPSRWSNRCAPAA